MHIWIWNKWNYWHTGNKNGNTNLNTKFNKHKPKNSHKTKKQKSILKFWRYERSQGVVPDLASDIAPVALRWFPATSAFHRMFAREICRKFASDSASEEAASIAVSRELWLGRLLQGLWSPPVVVVSAVAVLEFSGVGSPVEVHQSLREFSSPGVLFPLQGLQDSLLLLLLLRKSLTYLRLAGPGLGRAAGGYLCCLLQETPATFFLILVHRPESRSPVLGFYGGRKCTRVLGWWWWCCCCYSSIIIIITIPKE
jgi:hypothetical protein